MVRRILLGLAAAAMAGGFVFLSAAPAGAHVDGGCTGSGTFEKGNFTATAAEEGVVNVPLADNVQWEGALPSPPAGETAYSGKIEVELPPPFPALKIDSWSGTSDSRATAA